MRQITKRVDDYTFPWYSEQELVSIFLPCSKEIILMKISDWEERRTEVKGRIKKVLREVKKTCPQYKWFFKIFLSKFPEYLPAVYECDKHIYRLKRQLAFLENKRTPLVNFQIKLDRARVYPIYELARDKLDLRQVGRKFVALCPYHDEKTPSFTLYPETNTFHCYGCGAHGDVINLAQQLSGLTFKESVESLQ